MKDHTIEALDNNEMQQTRSALAKLARPSLLISVFDVREIERS